MAETIKEIEASKGCVCVGVGRGSSYFQVPCNTSFYNSGLQLYDLRQILLGGLSFLICKRGLGINLVAQTVKHLPAMQEAWVRSLAWEDPLEKEMATHSSTLAWKIPWTEEPCRLQSMGSQRVGHD